MLKKIIVATIFLIFCCLNFSAITVNAEDYWYHESIDSQAHEIGYSSMVLDSNDKPHITYGGKIGGDKVKYAYSSGSSWDNENVDNYRGISAIPKGNYFSIDVDTNNRAHIAYFYLSEVRYAYNSGSEWIIETVGEQIYKSNNFISLALDTNNVPHLCYYDYSEDFMIKYATKKSGSWEVEIVESGDGIGMYPSIDIDKNNNPHLTYTNYKEKIVKYAYWTGLDWEIEDIEPSTSVYCTTVKLDSSDTVHIVFREGNNGLKYATKETSGSWNIETVDSSESDYSFNSLDFDSSDTPYIAYCKYDGTGAKYAYKQGSSWITQTVEEELEDIKTVSLQIDSNDMPHICYGVNYFYQADLSVPSEPKNFKAEISEGYIRLTWEAPEIKGDSDITGYKIYKGQSGQTSFYETVENILSYNDLSVEKNEYYYYKICAVNSNGDGLFTDEIGVNYIEQEVVDKKTSDTGSKKDNINDVLLWVQNRDTLIYESQKPTTDTSNIDITEISYEIKDEKVKFTLKVRGEIDNSFDMSYSVRLNTSDAYYLLEYINGYGSCLGGKTDYSESTTYNNVTTTENSIIAEMNLLGEAEMVSIYATASNYTQYMSNLNYLQDSLIMARSQYSSGSTSGSPGFELILALIAILSMVFILRRKRKIN